jgi:hypothetical protein
MKTPEILEELFCYTFNISNNLFKYDKEEKLYKTHI